jgi:hypothetical protein
MGEVRYQFRPLDWAGPLTPAGSRKHATFKATYPATLGLLFRETAKMLHPDAGGGAADWDRLDQARQLLTTGGLL